MMVGAKRVVGATNLGGTAGLPSRPMDGREFLFSAGSPLCQDPGQTVRYDSLPGVHKSV